MLSDVLFATTMFFQISKSYIPIEQTKLTPPFTSIKQFFYQKLVPFFLARTLYSFPSSPKQFLKC